MTLRLVFMGTPAFALPTLDRLLAAGHEVLCVYTQPPRRAGRGQKLRLSPVHEAAVAREIEVRTPASLKEAGEQAAFAKLGADAGVVVAYGLLLPPAILDLDGDGVPDVIVGEPYGSSQFRGRVRLYSGSSGTQIMRIDGTGNYGYFGSSVAFVGDLDGDLRECVVGSHLPEHDVGLVERDLDLEAPGGIAGQLTRDAPVDDLHVEAADHAFQQPLEQRRVGLA